MTTKQTIFLSGRPPVRINPVNWPTIAGSIISYAEGPSIAVRRHADGRVIVYGQDNHNGRHGEPIWQHRDGVYFNEAPSEDVIVAAIQTVVHRLHTRAEGNWQPYRELIADTTADMPPEDLD